MYNWSSPGVNEGKYQDPPTNTIPNIRSFSDWVVVLQVSANQLCNFIDNNPSWFQETVGPNIVTSFNGRINAVVPVTGDYTVSQVTGAVAGPGSSTNNHVALFNGTTGLALKDGGALAAVATSGVYSDLTGIPSTFNPAQHALDSTTYHSVPTDNTNFNVTTGHHGLIPKLPGGTTAFFRADGSYAVPPGGGGGGDFITLGDVIAPDGGTATYSGQAYKYAMVTGGETGMTFAAESVPTTDLGARWPGIAGKSYADMDTEKDFVGTSCFGFPGGMSIGDFATTFPNYYAVLHTDLSWSDADILGLTYFTCVLNEEGYKTYVSDSFPFTRRSVSIPAGKHWYNSELRWGQGIITGAGAFPYFGLNGATQLALTKTNWKSQYGSQNDDTYMGICPWTYAGEQGNSVYPVQTGGGFEYCHNMTVRDLCMSGDRGDFNDPSIREVGFNYWSPGENSGTQNCLFIDHNDMGVIITGACAYGNIRDTSFFRNNVFGLGVRGVSRSAINISFISGDFQPVMIGAFRQGDTEFNGVPYFPCYQNGSPGGDYTIGGCKIESFACRSGFDSYSACNPDIPGKGQMLARLSGRFHFTLQGGRCTVHEGKVNSLIRLAPDTTIPFDNSHVNIQGLGTVRYAFWLHNADGNVKFNLNAVDADTHGNNFYWQGNVGAGLTARDPMLGISIGVTTATFTGYLPFSNDADPLTWNENAAPTAGYDNFLGTAY